MLFFTLTIAAAASLGAHAWHDRCDGFQLSEIEGISAELDFARYYTAGSLVNLDSLQGAVEDSDLPAFCSTFPPLENRVTDCC